MTQLGQVNLFVQDMAASVAFYRLLGFPVPDPYEWPDGSGAEHVEVDGRHGVFLALDNHPQARIWNPLFDPTRGEGNVVVGLQVDSRDEVDRLYARVRERGHRVGQEPYDAFFGARYAIVFDPDGNQVGLKSPIDPARRYVPELAPRAVQTQTQPQAPFRPVGFWARLLDQELEAALDAALAPHGLSRREWQLLHSLSEQGGQTIEVVARLQPFARATGVELHEVLNGLRSRGWVEQGPEGLGLTAEGVAAHAAAQPAVAGFRRAAAEGIARSDYATAVAVLERMARNLGWSDEG